MPGEIIFSFLERQKLADSQTFPADMGIEAILAQTKLTGEEPSKRFCPGHACWLGPINNVPLESLLPEAWEHAKVRDHSVEFLIFLPFPFEE